MSQIGFKGISSVVGTACGTANEVDCADTTSVNTSLPSTARVVGKTGVQFLTVPVWDTVNCEDDNIVRVYDKNSCVFKNGLIYWSTADFNATDPVSGINWTEGKTICEAIAGNGSIVASSKKQLKSPEEIFKSTGDTYGDMLIANLNSNPTWVVLKESIMNVSVPAGYNAVVLQIETIASTDQEDIVSIVNNNRMQSRVIVTGNGIERTTKAGFTTSTTRYNTAVQTLTIPVNADGTIKIQHSYRTKQLDQFPAGTLKAFAGGFVSVVGYDKVTTI